jgi:hypothetical protein
MVATDLEGRLKAVERLTEVFRFERIVHLSVTLASLAILLASAVVMFWRQTDGIAEVSILFGSSGVITYSASRLLRMWSDALALVAGRAPEAD